MDEQESQNLRGAMRDACLEGDFEKVFELIKAGQKPRHTLPWSNKKNPLHYAAFHGNLEAVSTLIDVHHCNPRSGDKDNCTPLHYACYGGHKNVVEYLVTKQKCSPMVKDHKGNLPLHFACMCEMLGTYHVVGFYRSHERNPTRGHFEVAKFLLKEWECKARRSKKHAYPLVVHLACRYGTAEFVQFLIEEKNCCPNNKNKDKDTPVHLASKYGHVEILRYLVEVKECSLVQQNEDENTPLHLACMFQHFATVQYLVRKQQALTMVANRKQELPTHIACRKGLLKIVKLVTSPSNVAAKARGGATPLHVASVRGSLEVVKWLIEEMHCDPNIKDNKHLTPLHHLTLLHHDCAYYKKKLKLEIVKYLVVSCGCDPMMNASLYSRSSLMEKAFQEDLEFVKALTSYNVNCVDKYGNTPLHLACRESQLNVVQFLVRHCRQDIQNNRGELPLHIACSQVSTQSYKWLQPPTDPLGLVELVSTDCDINVQTKSGDTPVHIACRHSQVDIVAYLTHKEKHCDVNITNINGKLPLHIACQQKSLEIVKLVSSCDLHAQTKRGFTAMHIACMNGAMEIVEYLVQEKHWELKSKLYDNLLIHCACVKGSAELVRKLANPTNVTKRFPNRYDYGTHGNMPLHDACKGANFEVVKILVEEFPHNYEDNCESDDSSDSGESGEGESGEGDNSGESDDSGESGESGDSNDSDDSGESGGSGESGENDDSGESSDSGDSWYSACDHWDSGESSRESPLHLAYTQTFQAVSSTYHLAMQNSVGDTPLHIACKHGQMEIVRYFSEKFVCDLTIQNSVGDTPLHIACKHGLMEIVRYFTEKCVCDPTIQNSVGDTPLRIACKHGLMEIQNSVGDTPLHIACKHGLMEIVRYLTEKCVCDPTIQNSAGDTPLRIACKHGLMEIQNSVGDTPLHIACKHGLMEIVGYLTEKCVCDSTIQNSVGDTPLHIACKHGLMEIVGYLTEKCVCDSTIQNSVGDTPLHIACKHGLMEIVRYLTEKCVCDPRIQNKSNKLAVHYACANSLEMVELVSDCELESRTSDGVTPLHIACLHGKLEIVRYLIEMKGCSPDVETSDGLTLLDYACGNTKYCYKSLGYTSALSGVTCLHNGNKNIVWCLIKKEYKDDWYDSYGSYDCYDWYDWYDWDDPYFDRWSPTYSYGTSKHSDATERYSHTSECSYPEKELNDEEKQAQAVTSKHSDATDSCSHTSECSYPEKELNDEEKQAQAVTSKHSDPTDSCSHTSECSHPQKELNDEEKQAQAVTSKHSDATDSCSHTSECSYPEKELNDEEKQAQAVTSKHSDATDSCSHTSECSYPEKQLNDEEKQAQAIVIRYLMNKCDYNPENVLFLFKIACIEGNLETAKLLCTNTDIVNLSDTEGNTPLHIACKYKHLELVTFLVEDRQCSQSVKNQEGELPLHIACHSKQGSTLEMIKLVSSKCDVNAQTVLGYTPLHYACYSGVVEVVQFLTEQCQCDQTIQNKEGVLPLHIACSQSFLEVVKLVCDCRVNVNAQTIKGDTSLHIAIKSRYKSSEVAGFLVNSKGADPSVLGGCGHSPIHEACGIRDLNLVKILTTSTTVNCQDKHGNTPLHIACQQPFYCDHQYLDIAKFLVEEFPTQIDLSIQNHSGDLALHNALDIDCEVCLLPLTELVSSCDPNMKNCDGDTPLHVACKHAAVQCIRYLVKERGCDVSVQNMEGELPLHIAAHGLPLHISGGKNRLNAVKLVEHCEVNARTASGDTPLHIACRKGNTKIVQYLLKVLNCDPNMQTSNGDTALHLICKTASCWKDQDLLCYLLKKKLCNPDIQNTCGETPLHIACQAQNLHTVKSIGKFVHNPNLTTLSGDTPLHVACSSNFYTNPRADIVRYLVMTKKCDQTIVNIAGELPLHLACKYSVELVKLVSNCNVDSQTVDGNTPLHIACKKNKLNIVKYLTETKYCDVNIQNRKRESPLHISCSKGSLEVARLVENCDVNAKTNSGDTPLHIVCRSKQTRYSGDNLLEVVKYLVKERRCDLTIQNNDEELPLHIACQNCSLDVIKLLSECNVELQTVFGDTPLHIACKRGSSDIVDYLITVRHCNPQVYNSDNALPLHIACETCAKLEVVKLLCSSDINVNTKTLQSGNTPLHYACRGKYYGEIDVLIKYLVVEKSGSPSIQNNNGQLPLHIACSRKNISLKLVELLSNCDADFNCRTLTGDTPLHEVCKVDTYYSDQRKQVVQFLVEKKHCDPNCQNNAGMTPLHYACKMNENEIVLYLLSTGKVGPSVTTKNSDGQTPVMLTDDIEIMGQLLKHGADPHPLYQRYEAFFKEYSSESPPPTPFNVLVLGNASTGKTTLIESLKAEGKLVIQHTHPDAHTAGIIPNRFESKEYGLVTFYDFAGQYEYYASHEAVIRTIVRSTPPAIILLVNISESEEIIKQKILYWLSFISNLFPTETSQPHLILTGSHADIVADYGGNHYRKMKSVYNSIRSRLEKSTAKFIDFTTMDCRVSESSGMNNLRHFLQKSSKELKDHGVINFRSHCFHIKFLECFQHLPAVSLSQITNCLLQKPRSEYHTYSFYQSVARIEDSDPKWLLPTKPSEIDSILEELSEKGHVVFLKSSCRQFSWVILNKEALLGDINGTVFAPIGFQQHKELASSSSTGVVSFSTIAKHFPKHDPNMIVSFLSHLEFCHVIADEEVLNLIEGRPAYSITSSTSSELYFLFPHLVSIECPQHIWRADENFEYKCGWLLWCSEDHHFFTPRLLQVILLRLAFSFALDIPIKKCRDHPAIQRRCSIWKNGISWFNEDGIEMLVEMREQNQVIAVMIRCIGRSATKTKCICLRSSVLQKILRMKEEFCSKVSTTESYTNPCDLQYPLKPSQDLTLFTLTDVAKSVVNTNPCVVCSDGSSLLELDKLLLFEPYNNLGEHILKELFDEKKKDRKMKDDFLYDIADQIVREADSKDIDQKKQCFLKLFNPHPTLLQERVCRAPEGPTHELVRIFQLWRDRSTDQSYGRLRRKLDEYSVFCGRNPLELIAVEEERC